MPYGSLGMARDPLPSPRASHRSCRQALAKGDRSPSILFRASPARRANGTVLALRASGQFEPWPRGSDDVPVPTTARTGHAGRRDRLSYGRNNRSVDAMSEATTDATPEATPDAAADEARPIENPPEIMWGDSRSLLLTLRHIQRVLRSDPGPCRRPAQPGLPGRPPDHRGRGRGPQRPFEAGPRRCAGQPPAWRRASKASWKGTTPPTSRQPSRTTSNAPTRTARVRPHSPSIRDRAPIHPSPSLRTSPSLRRSPLPHRPTSLRTASVSESDLRQRAQDVADVPDHPDHLRTLVTAASAHLPPIVDQRARGRRRRAGVRHGPDTDPDSEAATRCAGCSSPSW